MSEHQPNSSGITRRDLLKRGAALGGALAWSAPVVQMIGMTPALAAHASDLCLCAKWDGCTNNDAWEELGNSPNRCVDAPVGCETSGVHPVFVGACTGPVVDGEATGNGDEVCIVFHSDGTATLYYPTYCELVALAEKRGAGSGGPECINILDPNDGDQIVAGGTEGGFITFQITDECSHIEVCIDCT